MSKIFTYEERLDLQKYLKESLIARRIGKDPSTISREVRKYSSEVATGYPGFPFNTCRNRFNCRLKNICGKDCIRKSVTYCKLCSSCNTSCQEYIEEKYVPQNTAFLQSRGNRPSFSVPIFYNNTVRKAKNQTALWLQMWLFAYKTGFWVTKTAFHLQRLSFYLQIWLFVLQSGISSFN